MQATSKDADVTPDSLMEQFKGKSLVPILVFTVVVHLVLLVGTSVPFLWKSVFGADTSKLSEEERIKIAVEDATAALREIADEHGLNPQDISSQFSGGRRSAPAATAEGESETETPATPAEGESEREKSEYEKNLETAAEGPEVPSFEEEDDIF